MRVSSINFTPEGPITGRSVKHYTPKGRPGRTTTTFKLPSWHLEFSTGYKAEPDAELTGFNVSRVECTQSGQVHYELRSKAANIKHVGNAELIFRLAERMWDRQVAQAPTQAAATQPGTAPSRLCACFA